jgi:DNA-directed RNA polymerase subunit E'
MYFRMKLVDKVRVPPNRLGEPLGAVVLNVLQQQLEGAIDREIGIFIAVTKVLDIGEGELIQEVIEGDVVETTTFGCFVSLGPIDAMLHVSQISDDFINYDEKNGRLICQESKRFIGVGDSIRARVVTLSLNEREPRESKIGLTMRQAGLGTQRWLAEDLEKEQEKGKSNGRA